MYTNTISALLLLAGWRTWPGLRAGTGKSCTNSNTSAPPFFLIMAACMLLHTMAVIAWWRACSVQQQC
jgi:hypothetical protein